MIWPYAPLQVTSILSFFCWVFLFLLCVKTVCLSSIPKKRAEKSPEEYLPPQTLEQLIDESTINMRTTSIDDISQIIM